MEGKVDRVRRAIGSSGLAVGSCGTRMAVGYGMTTLGGDVGGRSSLGRCIGRRIERGPARVCEGVAQGGFSCGCLLLVVQSWIA